MAHLITQGGLYTNSQDTMRKKGLGDAEDELSDKLTDVFSTVI